MAADTERQQPVQEQKQEVTPEAPPNPGRQRRLLLGAALLGAVAVVAGVWYWLHSSTRESTDNAQVDGNITPISARVGGTVQQVLVNDNQIVEAGTLLLVLDPQDYRVAALRAQAELANAQAAERGARTTIPLTQTTAQAQLQNARAEINVAQAGVAAADTQIQNAEAAVAAAQGRLAELQAQLAQAARDVERYQPLLAKDQISRQQFDQAVTLRDARAAAVATQQATIRQTQEAVANARAGRQQAQARVAQAEAGARGAATVPQQINVQQSRAGSAGAQVQLAQAAVQAAQLNLTYTEVRAPVRGMIGRKTVQVGQVIGANQQLMTVVPLDDLWVTANFKETQLRKMRVGQPVEIKVDATDRTYRGRIDSIAPATGSRFSLLPPENATGNYVKVVQRVPVKIVFESGENRDLLLRPGMSVEPTVLLTAPAQSTPQGQTPRPGPAHR